MINIETHDMPEEPISLVFHNVHDHGVEIPDLWMNEISNRSHGRVHFTKSIGDDPAAIKAADLVRDVPVNNERYPLLNLIQTPFVFPSSTIGSKVIAQLYAEFPEFRRELNDVKIVGLALGASLAIFSSKAWGPIHTLEDFKGARTRSLTPIDGVVQALGAKPFHVPWFDMPRLLETRELDALILGVVPGYMFKLADSAAPYCTLTGKTSITMHPMRTYMKWDSWNRLPHDIRQIIDGVGPAGKTCWFAVQSGIDSEKHLAEALEYIKKNGELIEVAPAELDRWHRLVQPEIDSAIDREEANGMPARKFFSRMNALVTEYS